MNGRKLDSLGLAGVIVNFVFLGLETLGLVGLFIGGLVTIFVSPFGLLMIFVSVIFGSLTIVTTIFNAKVLNGESKFKTVTCVLGFICLSVFGSVLLLVSKEEVSTQSEKHDFSLVDTLTKFKALLDSGAITEEEYSTLKRNLMN